MNAAVELREVEVGGPSESRTLRLETHASTFGVWYPIGGGMQEKIVPSAFKRSLAAGPEMILLVNHGAGGGLPLAHTRGTPPLEVSEDQIGLLATADLSLNDPDVVSLRAKSQVMPLQASFSFRCNRDRWSQDNMRREVLEVNLSKGDITLTPFGANPETSVSIGSRGAALTMEQRRAFREKIAGRVVGPGFAFDESSGATLTVARSVPLVRSHVDAERARRAKTISGEGERRDDGPRYTDKQIQRLGEEGRALKKKSGRGYHYPIVDGRDVSDAVKAQARAAPSERTAVRLWIIKRAILLKVPQRLPDGWLPK
jgi:HK97 family phage prohead protease